MRKETKTGLTREKIINAALEEFGTNGYEAASISTVCEKHHISKGLIYHNFHSKDEIYLVCVEKIFLELVEYIKNHLNANITNSDEKLKAYISARTEFFSENPCYLKIFCEAVVFPPVHLEKHIAEAKKKFDSVNTEIIRKLTADLILRLDISEQKIIDTFCCSFDLIDAVSQMKRVQSGKNQISALDILLYGMIRR